MMLEFCISPVEISNGTISSGRHLPRRVRKLSPLYSTTMLIYPETIWQLQELDIPMVPAVLVEVENEDRYQYCKCFKHMSLELRMVN